jgi:hypothetical protein
MSVLNRHFRHLSDPDIALACEWLYDYRHTLTSIQYDVPVGEGTDPGGDHEPAIRIMWRGLTQRRIDAVAETDQHIYLLEICESANYKAIGQLAVYKTLFREHYPTEKPIHTVLLCRRATPEEAAAIKAAGHTLAVYPPQPLDLTPGL